jgi:hypothetical protein
MGRCHDSRHTAYCRYGARGIRVCPDWWDVSRFVSDIETSIGSRPANPDGWASRMPYWTLDRINNDGNYEPGNVRWATPADQQDNRHS